MSRLLRDRYSVVDDSRAWDLATGQTIEIASLTDEPISSPSLPALAEVLDHGREGAPRTITVTADVHDVGAVIRRAAADAARRGFVPIAVNTYLRLREALDSELGERALLLIATRETPRHARAALVAAAARSPRPHVLLAIATATSARPQPGLVREARAAYGGPALVRGRGSAPVSADVAEQLRRLDRAETFAAGGRHAASERLLRDVAGALQRRGAAGHAAEARLTLGRLLLERGRAADAAATFAGVASEVNALEPSRVWLARVWQASARADQGHFTAAEAICRAVLAVGAADDVRLAANTVLARVLLWQERADEAACLDLSGDAGDALFGAYAAATAVRVLLRAGRVFEAGQAARGLVDRGTDVSIIAVMAGTASLRVAAATGDCALAEDRLTAVLRLAAAAHTPLRAARARLVWADLLHRVGRSSDAQQVVRRLTRLATAAPPLLRRAIERRVRGEFGETCVRARITVPGAGAGAATLVALVNDRDDDAAAVKAVLNWTADALQASRLDVCSGDAGPVTTIQSGGAGLPTTLGARVLEAGIAIGPEDHRSGHEMGVPVRSGSRGIGALVARWPADRGVPGSARDVLELAAAVMAPRVEAMVATARDASTASAAVPELIGISEAILTVHRAVVRAAAAPFCVLIEGESGVGKELVARAVHHLSARRQRKFCDVNCAALPDDLFESELFGHARGAFTGALVDRAGLFEEADGGTLFLDELADLSPRAQAKLLRVLQQQEVRRIGESFSRSVDVRLVTAANRDMRTEAEQGRFRQDLLYRLDVIRIRIPPLRERPEDVAVLAVHFWRGAAERVGTRATLTPGVLSALARYHWPGNVRELQNAIAALAVAAPPRGRIRPALLPAAITGAATVTSPRLADARIEFERRFVAVALARAAGSRSRAARDLGLSRQGLLKLMTRLAIGQHKRKGDGV